MMIEQEVQLWGVCRHYHIIVSTNLSPADPIKKCTLCRILCDLSGFAAGENELH